MRARRRRLVRARARASSRGFTLLEVLVAVAILGMGLTAIMSSQAGTVADSKRGHNLTLATAAGRCKMTELEATIAKDGFQELDVSETGPCCDGELGPMQCAWRIEKPTLPEPAYGDLNLDTDIGGGQLGALGTLAQSEQNGTFEPGAGASAVAQALTGASADGGVPAAPGVEGAPAAASGIVGTVMQMVYPDLKAILETSSRKVTVEVRWTEGITERSYELVQWVTIPRPPPPDLAPLAGEEEGLGTGSATGPATGATAPNRGGGPTRGGLR